MGSLLGSSSQQPAYHAGGEHTELWPLTVSPSSPYCLDSKFATCRSDSRCRKIPFPHSKMRACDLLRSRIPTGHGSEQSQHTWATSCRDADESTANVGHGSPNLTAVPRREANIQRSCSGLKPSHFPKAPSRVLTPKEGYSSLRVFRGYIIQLSILFFSFFLQLTSSIFPTSLSSNCIYLQSSST